MREYEQRPINEFIGVKYQSKFDEQLAEMMREPTRHAADWYVKTKPPYYYYDRNYKGLFDGGDGQSKFKAEYFKRSQQPNSKIRDPYTFVDRDWSAHNMVEDPEVLGVIKKIVDPLPKIAEWIENQPQQSQSYKFANYLNNVRELLLTGQFDEAMIEFLNLPPKINIRWLALPVEYRGDPMGDKAYPQGLLAYVDRTRTDQANIDVDRYYSSAKEIYGEKPFPAWVFAADRIVASGDLALANSPKSGFHIPNDEDVAKKAKHSLIYYHPNSIEQVTRDSLSPILLEVVGVDCSAEDAENMTVAHEVSHGFKTKDERLRLGSMRTVVREGWAAARAVVLTANKRYFSDDRLASVIRSTLGFALSDAESFKSRLYLPFGVDQPSFKDQKEVSGYTPSGYWISRQAALRGAIGPEMEYKDIDFEKMVEILREQDQIFADLAKNGDEESAFLRLTKELAEIRTTPGFSAKKDSQAA